MVAKGAAVDAKILAPTLLMQLVSMRERLNQAPGSGQAAEACAKQAISARLSIVFDIFEVNTLLNTASLMNRICRQ